jgi:type IV pilus assembly protein PilF
MRALCRWALGLALLGSLLHLSGCATDGASNATTASGLDLTTASDEPDARKRARLRVELATGYFEQGKTTVALDEIKQALLSDPNYSAAFNLRGLTYLRMGESKLAEDSFRRALQLSPLDGNVAHNLGWIRCLQSDYKEAFTLFGRALDSPIYTERAKTWMTQGVCQVRAGALTEAEAAFTRAFELEPGNPITGYNLAQLLYKRGEYSKAQFHLRRINNSELANAETLWLGIKTERRLSNSTAERQLGEQLKRRFSQSKELGLYERGAFDE